MTLALVRWRGTPLGMWRFSGSIPDGSSNAGEVLLVARHPSKLDAPVRPRPPARRAQDVEAACILAKDDGPDRSRLSAQ